MWDGQAHTAVFKMDKQQGRASSTIGCSLLPLPFTFINLLVVLVI